MPKIEQNDPTQWFPMPAVLISSQTEDGVDNVMGLGYIGFCCWDPPTLYIGLNTARYSTQIIEQTKEFVVNVPTPDIVPNMDYCGFVSGANHDKFEAAGFTKLKAQHVNAPLIEECPVNIECKVKDIIELGSHKLFVADVLTTHVDENIVADKSALHPVMLLSRRYMDLSKYICDFGVSNGNPPEIEDDKERVSA